MAEIIEQSKAIDVVDVVEIDEDYDAFISDLVRNNSDKTIPNSNKSHALSILRAIFSVATNRIQLFSNKLDMQVYNDANLVNNLTAFLRKDTSIRLEILVNAEIDGLSGANLFFKELKKLNSDENFKNKIKILRIQDGNFLKESGPEGVFNNFIVADEKMFRLEVDNTKANAFCSFNSPEIAKKLTRIFERSLQSNTAPLLAA